MMAWLPSRGATAWVGARAAHREAWRPDPIIHADAPAAVTRSRSRFLLGHLGRIDCGLPVLAASPTAVVLAWRFVRRVPRGSRAAALANDPVRRPSRKWPASVRRPSDPPCPGLRR